MDKRKNLTIMINKLKTANAPRNLNEEFEVLYEDLKQTRAEIGQALDKRTEEMQRTMLNILETAISYMANCKDEEAYKYLLEQHKIIKKDLSDNDQEDRQVIIKIFE